MITLGINRFDGGMADDIRSEDATQFSVSKHFDIFTFPHRLTPLRGPTAISSGHVIGNVVVGTDGLFYGLGTDDGNPTLQEIYKIPDPSSPTWTALSSNSKSGFQVQYDLFVEYKNYFYTARSGYIMRFDRTDVASGNTTYSAVAWSNIAQGIVHPKDDVLYIPYDNNIWSLNGHGGTPNITSLVLPTYLKITAIAPYGNYLAIACTPVNNTTTGSIVYLWDRDTSISTVSESLDWGSGVLKFLGNLNGTLIGISDVSGASSSILDRDSLKIMTYTGGQPQFLKEISTTKQTTSVPDVVINPRVNFVFRDRLYFSANIQGGSTSPDWRGLWSLGKSKESGRIATTIERMATTDGSETAVLAAAIYGDYTLCVHSSAGTTTISNALSGLSASKTATSYYESTINPGMPHRLRTSLGHRTSKKQLVAIAVSCSPLLSGEQVVLKYRVDGGAWITIFTETTLGIVTIERVKDAAGNAFTSGREYEFRIESTGGAIITELKYKYEDLETLL